MANLLKRYYFSLVRSGLVIVRVSLSLLQAFAVLGLFVMLMYSQAGYSSVTQTLTASVGIVLALFVIKFLKNAVTLGISKFSSGNCVDDDDDDSEEDNEDDESEGD